MNQLATPRTDQHPFAVMTGHGSAGIGLVSELFGANAGVAPLPRHSPRNSEQRYADIFNATMDAIIAIDQDHHITLFNRAAEQVFCCTAEQAIGQAFDRFVPKRLRALLQDYLQGAELARQLWVPEGLTALRADGREFPVEATISALRLNGRAQYMTSTRVQKRRHACAACSPGSKARERRSGAARS
ncbi:MAG: PAS domain S-box protein [Burkholderiales bacterium]